MRDLSTITAVKDLTWRKESYDAGHPDCKCSACEEPILSEEQFIDDEFEREQASNDNFPIRMWRGEGPAMEEATLHTKCFLQLNKSGLLQEFVIGE